MKDLFNEGGIRNLYPGYAPRITRKALIGSLTWTLFEKVTSNRIHN